MKLSELIKQYQEKTGFNNATIAKEVGVSKATVGRWLNGEINKVQEETALRLSSLLGYDVSKILNDEIAIFKKPILGMAKGGYDLFLDSNYLGMEELTYDDYGKGDFFLRVVGDSMIGEGIKDGSLIYVRKTNTVRSFKIAVVRIADEVTVKRVVYKGNTLILEAANPSVPSRYFSKKEIEELPVEIIGEVIYAKVTF